MLAFFKSILFDFDGTLIDSWPAIRNAYQAGLSHLQPGADQSHIEVLRSDNREYTEAIKYVFKIREKNPHFEQVVSDIYMKDLSDKTDIFPGVEKVISSLDNTGKSWGIVTTKKRAFVEDILSKKPIFNKCRTLICGDDVQNRKPDPEGLLLACQKIGAPPAQTLYVGDLESDINAAQRGGLKSACALYGYAPSLSDAMLRWPADYYLHNIEDMLRP
jgi:phosphoglycolate phosphatase